jgi:hypothetical protein
VDKRTDPFPQHEQIPEGKDGPFEVGGRRVRVLSPNHPEWPGVPFIEDEAPVRIDDVRIGRYTWPGLRYATGRLYLGPTLAALFHPASPFRDFSPLQGVFLLHPEGPGDSPHQRLDQLCRRLYAVRGARAKWLDRVRNVPVSGVTDPTDHEALMRGITGWLRTNPFGFGSGSRGPVRLVVNLSPGTPSMHACWLMLRWSGELLRGGEGTVEFVQGDGGLGDGQPDRSPLRPVRVDTLSHLRPAAEPTPAAEPDPGVVRLEELHGPPWDSLREKLDRAALLGLPVLLHGERGTGKTFLARYYHERRSGRRAGAPRELKSRPREKVPPGVWLPRQDEDGQLVTVTLSEFAGLDNLRDTLFGWAERSWTGAAGAYDGLLGAAHCGTLFLDEVHHLDRSLQAALLGPLNNHLYRPKMAVYELYSGFDLVVATNDPKWRGRLADDFRDRIERIVLEVPSFRSLPRDRADTLLIFWDRTLRRRCAECGIVYSEDGEWDTCRDVLRNLFRLLPLEGNWRDLQRLADNLLLVLAQSRDGNPLPLEWRREQLELAAHETFDTH